MILLPLVLADAGIPQNLLIGGLAAVVIGAAVLLAGLIGLVLIVRRALRGKKRGPEPEKDLTIDISRLGAAGPPPGPPSLEFQGLPVRLAVLVLAPVGRSGVIPPVDQLGDLVNQIIPELMQIVTAHKPVFRRWPHQLSSQGFLQLFSANLKLPGDRGRNTPWCSVAGKFETGNQQYLAGLVLCADRPNSYTPQVLQQPGEWPGVLKVRLR